MCQADRQTFEFSITADGSITFDLTSFRQFIFGSNGFTGTDRRVLSFQLFQLHLLYGTVAHANNDNADADADAQAGADGVQGVPMQDDNEPPPATRTRTRTRTRSRSRRGREAQGPCAEAQGPCASAR